MRNHFKMVDMEREQAYDTIFAGEAQGGCPEPGLEVLPEIGKEGGKKKTEETLPLGEKKRGDFVGGTKKTRKHGRNGEGIDRYRL